MKIRTKALFIICSLFISVALSSCRFEDEDYFDEPAAQRIETTTNQIQQTLVSPQNGWVMQYFTATSDIEGFNLFARFENSQKVILAGNHRYLRDGRANQYTEAASLYQMLREDGPVLAFNTWNDVLTPFVDPVDPSLAPGTLSKDGEGMQGDQNFVVLSYGADEVLLRGERHSARVRLIPCPTTWEEYIASTETMKSYIANSTVTSYYVASETDTLFFKNLRTGVITYCERIDDPLFPTTLNCVFTPTGFRLQHQNNLEGIKFQEFTIAPDSTCLVSENDSVRVIACWDNYIINSTNSTVWLLDPAVLSASQLSIYNQLAEEAVKLNNGKGQFDGIGIGHSDDGTNGMVIKMSYTNSRGRQQSISAALPLTITRTAFGQLSVSYNTNAEASSNFAVLARNGLTEAESLTRQLAPAFTGTFSIVPNNYFLPTSFTLEPQGGGSTLTFNK